MSGEQITLTHPKLPGVEYACFAHQVEALEAKGWVVADEVTAEEAPAVASAAVSTPRAGRSAAQTSKESS